MQQEEEGRTNYNVEVLFTASVGVPRLSVASSSFLINESCGHNFHAAAQDVPLAVIVGNLAAAASQNSVQSTAAYDGQIALLPPLHQ